MGLVYLVNVHFHCVLYSFFRVDPFSKKDWYDVKAPSMFAVRQIGKTLVSRTQGTSKCIDNFSYQFTDLSGTVWLNRCSPEAVRDQDIGGWWLIVSCPNVSTIIPVN